MKHTLPISIAAAIGLTMFSLDAGFSSARGASNQNLSFARGKPEQSLRDVMAMPESLRNEFYRTLAGEMTSRYQFNHGNSATTVSKGELFWRNPAAWLEQKVTADDGQANDLMGFRVLISGDTAFISAPAPIYRPGAVYVFSYADGTWTQTQKLVADPDFVPPPDWSDFFGWSLAVSGDTLVIGSPFTLDVQGPTGAAFVFTNLNGTWEQSQQLKALDGLAIDYFGQAVGVVDDTAVVGAYNKNGGEGAAYVFTNSGGVWSQLQEMFASDGLPGDSHQFGEALAFDGRTIMIGAPGPDWVSTDIYPQGAAYVFRNTTGVWSEIQKLTGTDGAPGDQFGFAVKLSRKMALIGAPAANVGANPHQGAAYVFGRNAGTWMQTQKFTANDGVAYDQFGQSVALQGKSAVIGGWSHDDDPNHAPPPPKQGVSYTFRIAGGLFTQSDELSASDGETGDSFGWDVALDQGTILVGAQGTVGGNMYQGAAYFYNRSGN